MATYVIGDVQGCFEPLMRLLDRIGYRSGADRLWFAGDLVNRGPASLEVLRWARAEPGLVAVLGNHDLHLLASAAGARKLKRGDTLAPILAAPDREELLGWLRARPLMHREQGWLLVHAGLLPAWSVARAEELARELERRLREGELQLLADGGPQELRRALAALTRLRMVSPTGEPDYAWKGPPTGAPAGLVPWFAAPGRRWTGSARVAFGHWAALGLHRDAEVVGLDTGCVWGGSLSCLRLEDEQVTQVPARPPA